VSLFDVRFVQDSILERIGKACQFGVALCSVASIVQTKQGFLLAQSPWILPTVALSFVVGEFIYTRYI
jgi:hypothetical protein